MPGAISRPTSPVNWGSETGWPGSKGQWKSAAGQAMRELCTVQRSTLCQPHAVPHAVAHACASPAPAGQPMRMNVSTKASGSSSPTRLNRMVSTSMSACACRRGGSLPCGAVGAVSGVGAASHTRPRLHAWTSASTQNPAGLLSSSNLAVLQALNLLGGEGRVLVPAEERRRQVSWAGGRMSRTCARNTAARTLSCTLTCTFSNCHNSPGHEGRVLG